MPDSIYAYKKIDISKGWNSGRMFFLNTITTLAPRHIGTGFRGAVFDANDTMRMICPAKVAYDEQHIFLCTNKG